MYNESRYIARCLDSLKNQNYKDFELILIDDGSKDNTVKIAEWYKKEFDLTILQQKNSGPGKARNRWAKEAKGEILVFVDADMFFDKNYLKHLVQPIRDGQEKWTAHWSELVGNLRNPIARAYGLTRWVFEDGERSWVYRAFSKKVFMESWWYDKEKYAFEDNFSKKIWTALFIKNAICYHNNPESLKEIFKHEVRIWESLIAKWAIKHYIFKYKYRIIIFFISLCFSLIYLYNINHMEILPIWIVAILFILVLFKTVQRTITEKYLSHIIFIPLVLITRWVGYTRWIIRYLLSI